MNTFFLEQIIPTLLKSTAKIKFGLPIKAFTKLTIYSPLGDEIRRLVDSDLNAGYHEIDFNTSKLPSGTYICRIQSGDFIAMKKFVLINY